MTARYKLLEKTFVRPDDHLEASLHEAGAEILFSGIPGRSFEPLNEEARAAMGSVQPITTNLANILPRRGQPASMTNADRSIDDEPVCAT
jgi:hypothetical protein